jgi:hypothetical protein
MLLVLLDLLCRCARIGSSINQITVSISGCPEKQRRTDWPIDAADAIHIHFYRIYNLLAMAHGSWISLDVCFGGGPGSLVNQFQSSFPGTDPILDRASCSHEATKPKLAISGPPRETNRRIRNAPRMGKAIWESGLRVRTAATQNESGTRRQADRCRERASLRLRCCCVVTD